MFIRFWYNSLDVSQLLSIKAKIFMGAGSHKTECSVDVGGDTLSLGLSKMQFLRADGIRWNIRVNLTIKASV